MVEAQQLMENKKNITKSIIFFVFYYVFSVTASNAQAVKPAQIDKNGVLILVRGTLIALDQANKTGNYTVLRDIGAPGFQSNTAAKLTEIFSNIKKIDLQTVSVLEPQLTVMPRIESSGMMRISGYFLSVPNQINFEMLFAPVEGEWKIYGLGVSQTTAGPKPPVPYKIERK